VHSTDPVSNRLTIFKLTAHPFLSTCIVYGCTTEVSLRSSNAKGYIRTRKAQLYRNKTEKNRKKIKGKIKERCCYNVWPLAFNLTDFGGRIRSITTPASIAIWVNEISIHPPRKGDGALGITKTLALMQI